LQGVRVSNRERSSDQVVKPVNLMALTEWVGTFPQDLLNKMAEVSSWKPVKFPNEIIKI